MDEVTQQPTEQTVTISIPEDQIGTNTQATDNATLQPPIVPLQGTNQAEGASSPTTPVPSTETPAQTETVQPEVESYPQKEQSPKQPQMVDLSTQNTQEEKPKHPGGRPCEFCKRKDEILAKTRAYLDSAVGEKPKMIFLGEICLLLSCHKETLMDWAHKKNEQGELEHPEFSDLIKRAELIQETRLQQRILGRYNPTGAIFLLKTKHGYVETEKQIHAGDSNEPLEIVITEAKPLKNNE